MSDEQHVCSKVGCSEPATGVCKGCNCAMYCGAVHMHEDWAAHKNVCNLLVQEHAGASLWAIEAEVGELSESGEEKWEPLQMTHHTKFSVKDNVPLAEIIGARADFTGDLSTFRGTQRLPSGAMHAGETASVFVKTATFQTEVNVGLPGRSHYNIFKRNDGSYNVYLTADDIRRNGKFRPVPLSGLMAVGLGTAGQKVLVFGNYSVPQTAPTSTGLRVYEALRRFARRPRKVRIRTFDPSSQMAVSVTLEQDVSAAMQSISDANIFYNVTYVEIYVPGLFTQGADDRSLSWDALFAKELAADVTGAAEANAAIERSIACLADVSIRDIASAIAGDEGFESAHRDQEAEYIASLIGAFVAEEVGGDSPLVDTELMEDSEVGLVGAVISDDLANKHDSKGELPYEEIGANILSRWWNRRRLKRRNRRQLRKQQQLSLQQQQQQDPDFSMAEIQEHIDVIEASLRDYIVRKRNLSKQRSGLKNQSAAKLTARLVALVKEIKAQRTLSGRVSGDKVRLANSIMTQLDTMEGGSSPASLAAQKELKTLTSTTRATMLAKRQQARAARQRVKQASQSAIENASEDDDSASTASATDDEDLAKSGALVASLLQYQDVIRSEKRSASGLSPANKALDENISRVTAILTEHIGALANDAKGVAAYDVVPAKVPLAFAAALKIHKERK